MPLKTYYFARHIVFIIISLCLFYGCDTSQDSYLSKNQENATTSLVNPFYRMLDIAIKLSFIPQEKDIVQDNAHFLTTIMTQDSQTLWQDALRVPLDKEYSKWQRKLGKDISATTRIPHKKNAKCARYEFCLWFVCA